MKHPPNPLQDLLNRTVGFCDECLKRRDFASAWKALNAALALAPENASLLSHRGYLALSLKDIGAAQKDFRDALKLSPRHAAAWSGLARCHMLKGEAIEAAAAADQALATNADDEVALQVKAETSNRGKVRPAVPVSPSRTPLAAGSASARGLVIIQQKGFRRQPLLIESVQRWCAARAVPVSVVDHDHFYAGNWGTDAEDVGAFYLPITERYDPLERIPDSIPAIIDFDANGSSNIGSLDLRRLRYAVRNAFGMKVAANRPPEFQVPYLHMPVGMVGADRRDVIILDVKPFHGMPAQAAVLTLIAAIAEEYPRICKAAGKQLFIYFSSFMPSSVFMEAIDVFVRDARVDKITQNALREIASSVLPPAAAMSQYREILQRCCLFVTEHGDIADIDLVQIGSMGVPILLYQRLPFFRTAGISLQTQKGAEAIDPRIRTVLEQAEKDRVKPEWGIEQIFSQDRTRPWDTLILTETYMKSWDMLWNWAVTGTAATEVNAAMDTDYPWRLGLALEAR